MWFIIIPIYCFSGEYVLQDSIGDELVKSENTTLPVDDSAPSLNVLTDEFSLEEALRIVCLDTEQESSEVGSLRRPAYIFFLYYYMYAQYMNIFLVWYG